MPNSQSGGEESSLTATIVDSKPQNLSIGGWNIVDLVGEGAKKDGSEDIVPLMEELVGENTLFVLQKGQYLVDSEFDPSGWNRIGVVGRPHAEILVTDSEQSFPACFDFKRNEASAVQVENLTFNFEKDGVGPQAIGARVQDKLLIRNVDVSGQCDYIDRSTRPSSVIYPSLVTETGQGLVENLNLPDGSAFDKEAHDKDRNTDEFIENTWGLIGVNVYVYHKGTIRFRDCEVAGFPDAGMYLKDSEGSGSSIVEGGLFYDNGAADVRLGENDKMYGGKIIKNEEKGYAGPGLWLQKGQPVVRDTEIIAYKWGGEVVRVTSPGGVLDNLSIESSVNSRTVRLSSGSGEEKGLTVQNCDFISHGLPAWFAYIVNRGDVTHKNCSFEFVGDENESDSLVYTDEPCQFIDCDFDTTGKALQLGSGNVDLRGCRFNDSSIRIGSDCEKGLLCQQNRFYKDNITTLTGDIDEIAAMNIEM